MTSSVTLKRAKISTHRRKIDGVLGGQSAFSFDLKNAHANGRGLRLIVHRVLTQ
jgi:hypothetical protein